MNHLTPKERKQIRKNVRETLRSDDSVGIMMLATAAMTATRTIRDKEAVQIVQKELDNYRKGKL